MSLQNLPVELFEDVLQHVFQSSWALAQFQFLQLRLIDRRSDDIVSRIAFEALDPKIFLKKTKPPSSPTVQWLLFTKLYWNKHGHNAFTDSIHVSVSHILKRRFRKCRITGSYRNFLRDACCLIGLQHGVRFILSSLIYPSGVREHVRLPKEEPEPFFGCLHLASTSGDIEVVKELLQVTEVTDANSFHFLFGYPLHAAAHGGHVDILSLLLRHCAHVNRSNNLGRSPILVAAQMRRKEAVKFLLSYPKVQPNIPSYDGHTVLLWAVKWGWTDIVKCLLSTPDVDPNPRVKWEDTPLSAAVRGGFDDIFDLLLQRSNLQPTFRGGKFCPLWLATLKGDSCKVIRLLDRFSFKPNTFLRHRHTLLCKVISLGNTALARMLLERSEVDPNFKTSKGVAPFMKALHHLEILELLIARKDFDPNRIILGFRPLEIAYDLKNEKAIQLLLSRDDTRSDLHERDSSLLNRAASNGNLEVVRQLLLRPENDPNQQSERRGPPLCEAAAGNQIAVVKELLQVDQVNPNLRWNLPSSQSTPLCLAVSNDSLGMVQILLDQPNVDINMPGSHGTALCTAILCGSTEIFDLLLRRNDIDINITGPLGTALAFAARRGNKYMVQRLLELADIDVNRRSTPRRDDHMALEQLNNLNRTFSPAYAKTSRTCQTQHTPLEQAFLGGDIPIIKLLLSHPDIDFTEGDTLKRTPLWWASYMGPRELTELILDLGEDNVNAQDIDGWSPLLVAVNWRRSSVVQLLLKQATIDSNLANYDGWTCLHLAVQAGNAEMVGLLLQSPTTDPRKRLPDGRTPIDLAKHHGFDAMAKDLREQVKRIVRREDVIGKSSAMPGEKDQDS
ncbi:unnamed protein product [Clonostachys rhizophaga]|uniref:Uncharacterized protein n=1 Tax=Clonostachys rhizophaga TaxID=160324 RepID=A0A9N9VEW2_9HYPO|nr:unnamed protein product [Clonostachys rhizophaga]